MAMTLVAYTAVQYGALNKSALLEWSDAALVSWAVQHPAGQEQAVSMLLARYRPWIVQRCRFRLSSEQDAQDVAQQVAVRLMKSLSQLRDSSGFKAWLCRIIDNCCNTFAVQRARYVTNIEDGQLLGEGNEVTPSSLKTMEDNEAVALVLSQMSDVAREVLKLRFFDERSLEQIAHQLCLKLSAAKARLYRALAQFKTLYQQLVGF